MQWTPDVAAGEWLRERLDRTWQPPFSMHMVVPRGFPAYARILHPATRERPVGRAWPPLPHDAHAKAWAAFAAAQPEIDTEHVRWSEVAHTFGTRLHADSQWGRLVGYTDPYNNDEVEDAAGWSYNDPEQGRLDPDTLAAIAALLATHTTTPDAGCVTLWEGWGGLLGFMGSMSASASFGFTGEAPSAPQRGEAEPGAPGSEDSPYTPGTVAQPAIAYTSLEAMQARSIHNPWNDGYAKERWIPGVLSDEISRGPRLELPNRAHVLFSAGIDAFVDASWPERAPWADPTAPGFTQSPSMIWPEDRAWVLVTEIDFDSTVVAGSPALIAAICADPALEALPIPAEAVLGWEHGSDSR